MRKTILIYLISILILMPTMASAQMVVEDFETEYNTWITYLQALQSAINTGKQIQNQLINLKNLNNQQWDNAQQNLSQLGSIIQQGHALAYSMQNVDQQFKKQYPGYNTTATTNYSQVYKSWVQTNQDTMNGVLDQMNMSYEQLQQEDALNQVMQQQAGTVQGRLQAIQLANEIAAEQVAQLEKLKATMIAQTNAQAEYYAYQSQKDAAQQQSVDAVVQNTNTNFPSYQNNSQFGLIPAFGNGK